MTQQEVADKIGITVMTLHRWIKAGRFPECCKVVMGRRVNGTWDEAKVDAWITENVKEA